MCEEGREGRRGEKKVSRLYFFSQKGKRFSSAEGSSKWAILQNEKIQQI